MCLIGCIGQPEDVKRTASRLEGLWATKKHVLKWLGGHEVGIAMVGPEVSVYSDDLGDGSTAGRVVILGYVDVGNFRLPNEGTGQALLRMWRELGENFLDQLDGSFALVLYDFSRDRILMAVDRLSSRPIWLAQDRGRFVFATDVRYLARLVDSSSLELDKGYLWSFFVQGCTVAVRSPFVGLVAMEPGTAMIFERGRKSRMTKYAVPLFVPDRRRGMKETAAELMFRLRQTVEMACKGAKSPCLLLSGGLDSRLVASVCPGGMTAVTLCDSINREVKIAKRIAANCGLEHRVIQRGPDWYPSLVFEASLHGNGIWSWVEGHYFPLGRLETLADHDVAILGFGCNTYFKGNHLNWAPLWAGWQGDHGPRPSQEEFLKLVLSVRDYCPKGESVFRPEVRRLAEEAYAEAARLEVAQIFEWAETIPDLWELYWSRSLVCVVQTLNLVSLRGFISERNAFSSKAIHNLYLTVPPHLRHGTQLVRKASSIVGKGLAWIPDSNTWLPVLFPKRLHLVSAQARSIISTVRGRILAKAKSGNYVSSGSWPHHGRLWLRSESMHQMMEELMDNEAAFPSEVFDHKALRGIWDEHLTGRENHTTLLGVISTFGLFHQSVMSDLAVRRSEE